MGEWRGVFAFVVALFILDSFAVGPDDEVEAGRFLGAMGSAGRTTGPHLHFEARIDGTAIDPEPFLP